MIAKRVKATISLSRLSIFACIAMGSFFLTHDAMAAIYGVNKAAVVLCDVILLLRGRIGRAFVIIAVLGVAIGFLLGSLSWQKIMLISVGIGLFYGAETLAYVILPSTIKGISGTSPTGKVFSPNKKYTPEEVVREVCPELTS